MVMLRMSERFGGAADAEVAERFRQLLAKRSDPHRQTVTQAREGDAHSSRSEKKHPPRRRLPAPTAPVWRSRRIGEPASMRRVSGAEASEAIARV
jgi:hypothetical protein